MEVTTREGQVTTPAGILPVCMPAVCTVPEPGNITSESSSFPFEQRLQKRLDRLDRDISERLRRIEDSVFVCLQQLRDNSNVTHDALGTSTNRANATSQDTSIEKATTNDTMQRSSIKLETDQASKQEPATNLSQAKEADNTNKSCLKAEGSSGTGLGSGLKEFNSMVSFGHDLSDEEDPADRSKGNRQIKETEHVDSVERKDSKLAHTSSTDSMNSLSVVRFQMHELWHKNLDPRTSVHSTAEIQQARRSYHAQQHSSASELLDDDDDSDLEREILEAAGTGSQPFENNGGFLHRLQRTLISHPNSYRRLAWDLAGMVLIIYDLISIPFNIGFDPEETTFLRFMLIFTTVFWSTDVILTFFVGFYKKGRLEMRFTKVFVHYCKTWLCLDIAVITLDWVIISMTIIAPSQESDSENVDAGAARLGRTFRIIRILRSLRLLRLVKLKRIAEEVRDRISSEYVHILLDIVKHVVVIIAVNHVVACIWYGIGVDPPDGQIGWVHKQRFARRSLEYRYTTAMHWSLTQFTPASMEVFPHNVKERAFAVSVLLFALVVFSSFVSSITAAMTRMRGLNSENQTQFWLLRRYLKEQQVSAELTIRIKRYLEYKVYASQGGLKNKDVRLLSQLSLPLQMDLDAEAHRSIFNEHAMFRRYGQEDATALRLLCHTAIKHVWLSKGDMLFSVGTAADRMYFVTRGDLKYFPRVSGRVNKREDGKNRIGKEDGDQRSSRNQDSGSDAFLVGSEEDDDMGDEGRQAVRPRVLRKTEMQRAGTISLELKVKAGQWCSEAALWCAWIHVGSMQAATVSELVVLSAHEFQQITLKHHTVLSCTARYAQKFTNTLNALDPARLSDLHQVSQQQFELMAASAFGEEDSEGDSDEGQSRSLRVSSRMNRKSFVSMFRTVSASWGGTARSSKADKKPPIGRIKESAESSDSNAA